MKVAFIKEHTDPFGPWATVKWNMTSPKELLQKWPFKASYFEATLLLKADWYVVRHQNSDSWFARQVLFDSERKRIFDTYTQGIVSVQDIPYNDYDVVITLNLFLSPPTNNYTLFAYFLEEHEDPHYIHALGRPAPGYDLFLDHMLFSSPWLWGIPQAIAFPYLRDPVSIRKLFSVSKDDSLWIETRTLIVLSKSAYWNAQCYRLAQEIQERVGTEVRCKGDILETRFRIDDPPRWEDTMVYLGSVSRCKYFLSIFVGGGGQALADAASLGCICFGNPRTPYHRLICHPACLCNNLRDFLVKFQKVQSNPALQKEILQYQDSVLDRVFNKEPLRVLESALALKRGLQTPGFADRFMKRIYGWRAISAYNAMRVRRSLSWRMRRLRRMLQITPR